MVEIQSMTNASFPTIPHLEQDHHVDKEGGCKEGIDEVEEEPGDDQEGQGGERPPAGQHVCHHQHQVDRDGQGQVLPRVFNQIRLHPGIQNTLLQLCIVGVDEADDGVDVLLGVVEDDEVGDEGSRVEEQVEAAYQHW